MDMDKKIKDYTREELKDIILDNSRKLMEHNKDYRFGQAVFNYLDYYAGVARNVQFGDNVDCFYDDEAVDEFVDKAIDRMYKECSDSSFLTL